MAVEGTRGALRTRRIAANFTPYCDWDNRDPGEMVVWVPETPELAELLGESGSVVSNGVRLAASHCWSTDKLEALNDGRLPSASNDESIPRMTWWDHRGTVEWVSCEFPEPREISSALVWWFDDQPRGGCAVPASWRLLWRDGEEWRPVELAAGSSFGVSKDAPNEARFARVRTRAVKLEATLAPKKSAGILEWRLVGPMTGTGAPDLPGEGAVLLRMSGIRKAFPGTQALDGVDFEVRAGEIHALVGENGAGKTTLIKILTGVHRADGGAIELLGQPFEVHSPHEAERRGIATIYQEVHLIPRLSVAENVFLGRHPRRAGFVSWREMERRARIALGRFDLDVDVRTPAGSCPVAVQQLVAIARAVDLDARLLVMDEPTSSLAPAEVERLFGVMRRLRDSGLGIVFVAHALDQVLAISDRVTVLRNGRRVGTFETASLDRLTLVRHSSRAPARVGGARCDGRSRAATDAAAPGAARARPALEVRGLERRGVVGPIDLDVRAGEIVGIAGLLGSGRTEALLLLFGADRATAGTVHVAGQPARLRSPREAIARGIGFCPEDRKADAVFPGLSLRENLVIAARRRIGGWFPSRRRELALCRELVDRLGIVTSGPEQPMATLSGGNQQKVILARWLATRPLVLLLDDPTRGVDVGARAQIEGLVTELAAGGMAVVLTSSALEELLGLAGRVVVLRERRQVAELAGAGLNAAAVLRAIATGAVDAG